MIYFSNKAVQRSLRAHALTTMGRTGAASSLLFLLAIIINKGMIYGLYMCLQVLKSTVF